MESIVNYESDDGNVKITNKTSAKVTLKQHKFKVEIFTKVLWHLDFLKLVESYTFFP